MNPVLRQETAERELFLRLSITISGAETNFHADVPDADLVSH